MLRKRIDQSNLRADSSLVLRDKDLGFFRGVLPVDFLVVAPGVEDALQQRNILWRYAGVCQVHLLLSQDDKLTPNNAAPGIERHDTHCADVAK